MAIGTDVAAKVDVVAPGRVENVHKRVLETVERRVLVAHPAGEDHIARRERTVDVAPTACMQCCVSCVNRGWRVQVRGGLYLSTGLDMMSACGFLLRE